MNRRAKHEYMVASLVGCPNEHCTVSSRCRTSSGSPRTLLGRAKFGNATMCPSLFICSAAQCMAWRNRAPRRLNDARMLARCSFAHCDAVQAGSGCDQTTFTIHDQDLEGAEDLHPERGNRLTQCSTHLAVDNIGNAPTICAIHHVGDHEGGIERDVCFHLFVMGHDQLDGRSRIGAWPLPSTTFTMCIDNTRHICKAS